MRNQDFKQTSNSKMRYHDYENKDLIDVIKRHRQNIKEGKEEFLRLSHPLSLKLSSSLAFYECVTSIVTYHIMNILARYP
jgi:hypothetical protein